MCGWDNSLTERHMRQFKSTGSTQGQSRASTWSRLLSIAHVWVIIFQRLCIVLYVEVKILQTLALTLQRTRWVWPDCCPGHIAEWVGSCWPFSVHSLAVLTCWFGQTQRLQRLQVDITVAKRETWTNMTRLDFLHYIFRWFHRTMNRTRTACV